MGEPGGHDHEVSDSVQPDSNYFNKSRSAWKMQALQMFPYLTYLTKQLMLRNITSYVCTQIVQTKQLVHHLSLLETSITSHRWRRAMSFNSICRMSTHYRRCKTVGRLEWGYVNVKGACLYIEQHIGFQCDDILQHKYSFKAATCIIIV